MYNKEGLKKFGYKLPFYSLWIIYIWKFKKFPYFMYFQQYKKERIIKQGGMILIGFICINAGFGILEILNHNEFN
jgi:hypothetical protein